MHSSEKAAIMEGCNGQWISRPFLVYNLDFFQIQAAAQRSEPSACGGKLPPYVNKKKDPSHEQRPAVLSTFQSVHVLRERGTRAQTALVSRLGTLTATVGA